MSKIPSGVGWISWRAVSSKPQAETESLSEQHRLNLRTIEEHGGFLFAELEVPGISRSLDSFEEARELIPAYEELWQIINSKPRDQLLILVARDRSRLGRTVALIESVARACNMAGIAIYPRSMPPLTVNPKEQQKQMNLLYGMFGSVESQIEIERLVERRASGMMERAKDGLHPGKLPFWLDKVYDQSGDFTYQTNEYIDAVLLWVDLYLDGESLRQISIAMNEEGYRHPTGRKWEFGDILYWGRYYPWRLAGYIEFNIKSPNEYVRQKSSLLPEVITEDQAIAIEEEANHRKKHRVSKGKRRFSFAALCGYCGEYMVGRKKGQYVCRNRCRGSHIYEYRLTEAIYEALRQLSTKVDRKRLAALLVQPQGNLFDDVDKLEQQIDGLRKQQERLLFAYTSGAIEFDSFQSANTDFKSRILSTQEKLDGLRREREQNKSQDEIEEMLNDLASIGFDVMSESTDDAEVNRWLRDHFRLIVLENKVVEVGYR